MIRVLHPLLKLIAKLTERSSPRLNHHDRVGTLRRTLALTICLFAATAHADSPERSLVDDPLSEALAAEFALIDESYELAARRYASAARAVKRADYAERAARIALYSEASELALEMSELWLSLDPDNAEAKQSAAMAGLRARDPSAAIRHLRELMKRPEHVELVLHALAEAGDKAKGLKVLQALHQDPGFHSFEPSALSPVSLALRWKDVELARALAERSLAAHPNSSRAHLWRAATHLAADENDSARDDYRQALQLDRENIDLRLAFVQLLGTQKRFDEVEKVLRSAPKSDVRLYEAEMVLWIQAKQPERYSQLARRIKKDRLLEASGRDFLLGQIAELKEEPALALKHYRQVREPPQVHDAALRIAVLSFDENPESAREVLRSVQDSGVKQAHSAFLLEAELDSGARNFDAAIQTLARGLSFFPDDPGLLYARALAFANANETALAESDLRLLLERDPENAATLNALGYTLLTQSDRLEEAGKLIRRAFALEPKDPAILDSIGWLLFKQGDAAKALPYLEKAFAESKDPEVIAHLGEVLLVLGETERALSLWRDSLAAHGSHPIFKEAIERLAPGLSSS